MVNVGDRVFFESDQTDLTPQAIATLEKQARWLQSYNRYSFTIEGHADERGTREYNIALGARRAGNFQTVRTARDAPEGLPKYLPGIRSAAWDRPRRQVRGSDIGCGRRSPSMLKVRLSPSGLVNHCNTSGRLTARRATSGSRGVRV